MHSSAQGLRFGLLGFAFALMCFWWLRGSNQALFVHVEFYCYSVEFTFFHFFWFSLQPRKKRDTRPRFGVVVMAGRSSGFLNPVMLIFLSVLLVPFSLRVLPGF